MGEQHQQDQQSGCVEKGQKQQILSAGNDVLPPGRTPPYSPKTRAYSAASCVFIAWGVPASDVSMLFSN
jgi:hypothetical protein